MEILAVDVTRSEYNVHEGNRYIDFSVGTRGTLTGVAVSFGGSGYDDRVPPLSSTGSDDKTLQRTSLLERDLGISFEVDGRVVCVHVRQDQYRAELELLQGLGSRLARGVVRRLDEEGREPRPREDVRHASHWRSTGT